MNPTTQTFLATIGCAAVGAWWVVTSSPDPIQTTPRSPVPSTRATGKVAIMIASSVTKQRWMEAMVRKFHAARIQTGNGSRISVSVKGVLSGGSMWKILDGKLKPVAWSPGAVSWTDQFQERWVERGNAPAIRGKCEPTVYSPIGFAMWRPMAEALGWPDRPIGWQTIVDLAADPQGWARYGHPEWGQLKLGHPHPKYSSAGMLYMSSLAYGVSGKTSGLTSADIYDPKVEAAMRKLAAHTTKYGMISTDLLSMMARHGPGFLHVVSAFEEGTVRLNLDRADELRWPVVFVFPSEGTFWSSHPYCILDGTDWVTKEQAEAARIFFDYLHAEAQQKAAVDHLLRPLDESIPVGKPLLLENGADPRVRISSVPPLEAPDSDATAAIIDQFMKTKRKSSVLLVLDVSGSMKGKKIRAATQATAAFLQRLHPDDEVGLIIFNDNVRFAHPFATARESTDDLVDRVRNLVAGGGTALHEAVCVGMRHMRVLQREDRAAAEQRMYGVVLLSDGKDGHGVPTENVMFAECLSRSPEAEDIKMFTIAFGDDAHVNVLRRIAHVSRARMYTADAASIERAYLRISAEQ